MIGPVVTVPQDSIIDSGQSQRLYVENGDGTFESRQVETGKRFGRLVQILSGLSEGERVVVSGAFLVDVERRLHSPAESYDGAAATLIRRDALRATTR